MGNGPSKEEQEKRDKEELESFRRSLKDAPDLRVDQNIQRFTSLDSPDNLRHHCDLRNIEFSDFAADWVKNLSEKLAALTPAPELAGLGALAIAVFIDISMFSPPEESIKEALRSVFAEEKVSKVWDLVEECVRRTYTYITQRGELVSNLKELERQLSSAITSLKNSMEKDGHMSSPSLRVWVNAAAFHIQLLVHLVRLGGLQASDPAERLLHIYENDLLTLFSVHRKMILGRCKFVINAPSPEDPTCYYLRDEESCFHMITISAKCNYEEHVEVYYDQRFGQQLRDIQQYFSNLKEELPDLVHQEGTFP